MPNQYKYHRIYHKSTGDLFERYGFRQAQELCESKGWDTGGYKVAGMWHKFHKLGDFEWESGEIHVTTHKEPTGWPLNVPEDGDPDTF